MELAKTFVITNKTIVIAGLTGNLEYTNCSVYNNRLPIGSAMTNVWLVMTNDQVGNDFRGVLKAAPPKKKQPGQG